MIQLVCEVGYNHIGNIENAINIIDAFSDSCDVFKFQKMVPRIFLKKRYTEKNRNNVDYFGKTYGEHREKLELSVEDHKFLKEYIESKGKKYSCSVHDLESAKAIIPLDPYYVKIASPNCNNWRLIRYCLDNIITGPLHISTGMTTIAERRALMGYSNNILLYSCTACYIPEHDVFIERMPGFSCHVPDIFWGQAAILNGAKFIEYHCTTDRSLPGGVDQKISLLPDEYMKLRNWIKKNEAHLKYLKLSKPAGIPDCEIPYRKKRWSAA